MSATFGSKDIVIRKSEFGAKTQFLLVTFLTIKSFPNCEALFAKHLFYCLTYIYILPKILPKIKKYSLTLLT